MEYFNGEISYKEKLANVRKFAVAIVFSFVSTFILQLIWNYFAPMFNLPVLGYWEIYALKIGARILFRGVGITISK